MLIAREAVMVVAVSGGLRLGLDISINWAGRSAVWPTMAAVGIALILVAGSPWRCFCTSGSPGRCSHPRCTSATGSPIPGLRAARAYTGPGTRAPDNAQSPAKFGLVKAVVMAGGEGTRLRPLTSNQPKPMVPIAGKPCMEHIVELVRRHGLTSVVATLAYMPQVIRGYFAEGSHLGVELDYSVEETPAGTAGSVRMLQHYLDETFLVISGDAVTDIDLRRPDRFHRNRGAAVTLALKRVPDPLEFGVVITGEDGRIERFLEKPSLGRGLLGHHQHRHLRARARGAARHPARPAISTSRRSCSHAAGSGAPLYGWIADGYWMDIGNIAQFQQANRDALDRKVELEDRRRAAA